MTNKELWAKEFNRISRIAKGLSKGTNIEFVFPKQPKRIEKKGIERLRKITPSVIKQLIAEQEAQGIKPVVKVDIQKAVRAKAPDEPNKGYRYQAISPEERARRAKKAAATRAEKGIKPFGNLTKEEREAQAKKAAATRAKKGIKPFGNLTKEERQAAAKKAAETRAEKGIKPFSKLTKEQRSAAAKKAAATRKAKGIKPFGNVTDEQRKAALEKARQTMKEKGIKPFSKLTKEQRSAAAKKAAATRKAKGIKPFGTMTPEQRKEAQRKSAETRRKNKTKRIRGDKVEFVDEETGEIEEEELDDIGDEEIPDIDEYALIIENYLQQLQQYQEIHPQGFFIDIIIEKLYMFQGIYGERAVALALAKMADEGVLLTVLVVYDTDHSGEAYLGKMVSYLTSNGVLTDEEGLDIWRNSGYTENYFDYMGGVEEEQEYLNRTYVWTDGV